MAWVIAGRVVPLAPGSEQTTFRGKVWISDDGRIAGVTKGTAKGPFVPDRVVDVGSSLVAPGFIDLHNHLAYNTLPLWAEPSRTTPWENHNQWVSKSAPSYSPTVTWPAWGLVTAAPEALLAFVEVRALVGGTTSIQGSPPSSRPLDGWLVRNIDDETFGTGDRNLIYASVLTKDPTELGHMANKMRAGAGFIYHCGEGQPGSVVTKEYAEARRAGCLQDRFVAVHASAIADAEWDAWASRVPGAVAWSPFSNLWLYGTTTNIPKARAAGVGVCLGSDWGPSGTRQVLGEVKVARIVSDHFGWGLTDLELVMMMTANPGDWLARCWGRPLGRLVDGAVADVVVMAAPARKDPFRAIVDATERDVEIVVIDGQPRYGTTALMTAAKATPMGAIPVAGESRRVSIPKFDKPGEQWTWKAVLADLERVRADPRTAIKQAQARLAAWAGPLDAPGAPLRLALDMPTGVGPTAGGPKDLAKVVIPPLTPLAHDDAFFDAVATGGFHGGVLNALAAYY